MAPHPLPRRARLEVTALEGRLLCTAQHVPDSLAFPYRAVAKVYAWFDINHNGMQDNGELFGATATLIGNHTALTAGHVVYDPGLGGFATSITIVPALNGAPAPLGVYNAHSWIIPASFRRHPYAGDDLAVLNFTQALGPRTGLFGIKTLTTTALRHATLNNIGYPGDTHSGDQQFLSQGLASAVTATEIHYPTAELQVEHGSSGSPIFVVNHATNRPYLVGVHSRRIDNGAMGLSARITPLMAHFIHLAEAQCGHGGFIDPLGTPHRLPTAAWDAAHCSGAPG